MNIAGRLLCAGEIEFLDLNDDFLVMKDERDQKNIELKESIDSMEAYVNENLILQKENNELKAEINMVMEEKEKLMEDLRVEKMKQCKQNDHARKSRFEEKLKEKRSRMGENIFKEYIGPRSRP